MRCRKARTLELDDVVIIIRSRRCEGSGSFLSGGLAVKEGITSHATQEIQGLTGRGRVVVCRWDRCLKVFLRDVRWRTRLELKELL